MTEGDAAMPQDETRVGARLHTAREAAGLSLADIATRTRVNARHLRAIETGDFVSLPAAPYSVGFVKAYARELGLDGAQLSADFRRERDGAVRDYPHETERYEPSHPGRLPSRALAWTAAVIALLILVGYAAWRSGTLTGQGDDDRARVAAQTDVPLSPVPTQRPSPPMPTAVKTVPAGGAVVLTATEPAWIKVYERDGRILFQGELAQGQTYEVPATAQDPLIRLGRAEAVSVMVGGRAVAPLGPPARTVKDVSLRAQALLDRSATPPAAASFEPAA